MHIAVLQLYCNLKCNCIPICTCSARSACGSLLQYAGRCSDPGAEQSGAPTCSPCDATATLYPYYRLHTHSSVSALIVSASPLLRSATLLGGQHAAAALNTPFSAQKLALQMLMTGETLSARGTLTAYARCLQSKSAWL